MQNVHWNNRAPDSASSFGVRVGIRRRRRLSLCFEFKLLSDPKEFREPCDHAEPCDCADPEDIFVNPVSKDVVDGALKTEKLPVLPFELPWRPV